MTDISGISGNDALDVSHTGTNKRETDVQRDAVNQPKRSTEMQNQESLASSGDSERVQRDARTTNQVETAQSREVGNDNKSQTEASRTLGKMVDVFA
mgnify:FL=1